MRRICPILFVLVAAFSLTCCSSENTKIKKALKASIPAEKVKEYKYKSHQLIETQLKNSIEDSISTYESSNRVIERLLVNKYQRKDTYQENLDDCRRQQRNTLSWLSSSYNGLIRDWQRMLDDITEEIAEDSLKKKFFRHRPKVRRIQGLVLLLLRWCCRMR